MEKSTLDKQKIIWKRQLINTRKILNKNIAEHMRIYTIL